MCSIAQNGKFVKAIAQKMKNRCKKLKQRYILHLFFKNRRKTLTEKAKWGIMKIANYAPARGKEWLCVST
jgi:hypothetical protein